MGWTDGGLSEQGPVAGFCEYCKELLFSVCKFGRVRTGVAAGFPLTHEPMDPFREDLLSLLLNPLRYSRTDLGTISTFRMKGVKDHEKRPSGLSRFKSETSRK